MKFKGYIGNGYFVQASSSYGRWQLTGEGKSWADALLDLAVKLERYERDPKWGHYTEEDLLNEDPNIFDFKS